MIKKKSRTSLEKRAKIYKNTCIKWVIMIKSPHASQKSEELAWICEYAT